MLKKLADEQRIEEINEFHDVIVYDLAKAGLDMGHENMFSPDSVVIAGGGSNGMERPDDWKEVICRYAGIKAIFDAYGMSEVMGYHVRCSHNRYHTPPWIIPFILDPETSETMFFPR